MTTSTTTRIEVALDSPLAMGEEERYRTHALDTWQRLLFNEDGLESEALPRAFDEKGEVIDENVEASEEILSRVGGLVVASYRVTLLPFDESVLLHMNQAAEAEIPVFVQTPYDKVIKNQAGSLHGEVIAMKLRQHAEIVERLGDN